MILKQFLFLNIALIIGSVYIVWYLRNKNEKEYVSLHKIINRDNLTLRAIFIGSIFGFVFGFIDNAGMFFGMDALEPFLPSEGFVAAGIGNTYSSILGAFLAAFLSNVIKIGTGVDSVPVWSDAAGITVGAMLGIYLPPIIIDMF